MRHLTTSAHEVHSLRFSADGKNLSLLSNEVYAPVPDFAAGFSLFQRMCRIDLRTERLVSEMTFSGSEAAEFTPDMRWLYHSVSVAVAGRELDLRRLDLVTGKDEFVYTSNVPCPSSLAFVPNGHILAIGGQHYSGDGRWCVHRLDVWHTTELEPLQSGGYCVAYSPDGRMLATGGSVGLEQSSSINIWEGKRHVESFPGGAHFLSWSADGQLGWVVGNRVNVTRPALREPPRVLTETGGRITGLAFSPDSRVIVTGSQSGFCCVHESASGRLVASFDWGIGPIHSVAFSPDGLTCAAGGENGQVVIWDVDG